MISRAVLSSQMESKRLKLLLILVGFWLASESQSNVMIVDNISIEVYVGSVYQANWINLIRSEKGKNT